MQLAQPGLQPRLSEADNRISKSDRVGASSEHRSQLEATQRTAPPSPSQDSLDFISHMDVVKKIWRLRWGRCNNLKLNLDTTFMTKGVAKAISSEAKRSEADTSLFTHVERRTIHLVQTWRNTNSSLTSHLQSQQCENTKLLLGMIDSSILAVQSQVRLILDKPRMPFIRKQVCNFYKLQSVDWIERSITASEPCDTFQHTDGMMKIKSLFRKVANRKWKWEVKALNSKSTRLVKSRQLHSRYYVRDRGIFKNDRNELTRK